MQKLKKKKTSEGLKGCWRLLVMEQISSSTIFDRQSFTLNMQVRTLSSLLNNSNSYWKGFPCSKNQLPKLISIIPKQTKKNSLSSTWQPFKYSNTGAMYPGSFWCQTKHPHIIQVFSYNILSRLSTFPLPCFSLILSYINVPL